MLTRQCFQTLLLCFEFLNFTSYAQLLSTCKSLAKYKNDATLRLNSGYKRMFLYSQIFDYNKNVFLTGPGGCGKTFCLNAIYSIATRLGRHVAMTSTTGASSLNVFHGQTLHSFSGLRKGTISIEDLKLQLQDTKTHRFYGKVKNCDLLIIDEVSMLGKRFLDKLDLVAKTVKNSSEPFGGIQVVFSGDFLQLRPVGDYYAFQSDVWPLFKFVTVQFTYPFRQTKDLSYYNMLQRIRIGKPSENDIKLLKQNCKETKRHDFSHDIIKPTHIFCYNKDVAKLNMEEFNKLTTKIELDINAIDKVYQIIKTRQGSKTIIDYQETDVITVDAARKLLGTRMEASAPSNLKFREGAQYILTMNADVKKSRVNGSRMVYTTNYKMKFLDGTTEVLNKLVKTSQFIVPVPGHSNIVLVRKQFAVKLGYACTIHSSQGMSLDSACIDLGKTFAAAMSYVALSRIRTLKGLYLLNFNTDAIKTADIAKRFYKQIDSSAIKKKKNTTVVKK